MIKTCDQCKKVTTLKEQISYCCFCEICHYKYVEYVNYALDLTYKAKFELCKNAFEVEQVKKSFIQAFNTTNIIREKFFINMVTNEANRRLAKLRANIKPIELLLERLLGENDG